MADNAPTAGEENEEINNYDLDDDFPEYANEQNKELNQIVREKIKMVQQLNIEIEEHNDRFKILQEHLKSVQQELVHTQSLVDQKNKEIESEEHLKQIAERQSGRLNNELKKLEQRVADQQDRLNNIQNMIFKANERMDQFKLEMNWNQEELEQWALAARQKEEDNLTLEKYRRADEAKIKELTLQIEKLTIEVSRKAQELEKEVTETQAAQIELDKTADEFKRLHAERHQLYLQWQETVENSEKRNELISETGEHYANSKLLLGRRNEELQEAQQELNREKENNKELESQISSEERLVAKIREENKSKEKAKEQLEGDVAISKNQLSAFATELANKRSAVANMNKELEVKMGRLEAAKRKFQVAKDVLSKNQAAKDNLEAANKLSEEGYKESETMMTEVEKEIRTQKGILYDESQKLFKYREEQAHLIGLISGTLSASRNLVANIKNLEQVKQRQDELLYNADFHIQQMERKVQRMQGDRSQEEMKQLNKEILELQKNMEELEKQWKTINNSNKQLIDELRTVSRQRPDLCRWSARSARCRTRNKT